VAFLYARAVRLGARGTSWPAATGFGAFLEYA